MALGDNYVDKSKLYDLNILFCNKFDYYLIL